MQRISLPGTDGNGRSGKSCSGCGSVFYIGLDPVISKNIIFEITVDKLYRKEYHIEYTIFWILESRFHADKFNRSFISENRCDN